MVKVEVWTGYNEVVTRNIETVGYWEGNHRVEKSADKDLVAKLLIQSNHEKSNAVVTDYGHLYLTFDVPGYCDGELTVKRML
jgi:hypothetical protein